MAKFTPTIGTISGKLNGSIYARNKAGHYIKSFRMPTNPRSIAQLGARSKFTTAVTSWHNLNDDVKQRFNNFAANFFKPKWPVAGVLYSGFNSFVSLNNQLLNIAQIQGSVAIDGLTYTGSAAPSFCLNPPGFALSATVRIAGIGPIGTSADVSIEAIAENATFNTDKLQCSFQLGGSFGPANVLSFEDGLNGVETGILVMASLPSTQSQQFTKSPKYTILCASDLIGPTTAAASGDVLPIEFDIVNKNRKLEYQEGEIVEMNCFLFNSLGQTQPIGSFKVNYSLD